LQKESGIEAFAQQSSLGRRKMGAAAFDSGKPLTEAAQGKAMTPPRVKKRCIFHIGGYEPIGPDAVHKRFVRELERFKRTWSVDSAASQPASPNGHIVTWRVETAGPNWRVDTEYNLLAWHDIVLGDFERSAWVRLSRALAVLLDFLITGTLGRFIRASWRFSLYFLYPFVVLALFAAAAALLGIGVAALALPGSALLAPAAGLAIFMVLLRWAGPKFFLSHLLDLWIFTREFMLGTRPDVGARLQAYAEAIAERARDRSWDEIVIVGHSTGGALMLDIAARALRIDPDLGRHGPPVWLLTVGSTALKVGLYPRASWFRETIRTITAAPGIRWVEYQALVDLINFYKTNPVKAMGISTPQPIPIVRIARIRDMLDKQAYRRMRGNFFRIHYQFVMGNSRRYHYDYYMICCGPIPLAVRADAPKSAVSGIGADGSLASYGSSPAGEAVPVGAVTS